MKPANLTLEIYKGATFKKSLTLYVPGSRSQVEQLSTYSARMHIRPNRESSTIYLSLTTSNGRITLADTDPNISLDVAKADTAALSGWVQAVYDLEIESAGGEVDPVLEGTVKLIEMVTRE